MAEMALRRFLSSSAVSASAAACTRNTSTHAHGLKFKVACVQLSTQDDVDYNIAHASSLIRRARSLGADLIVTPENTGMMTGESAQQNAYDPSRVKFEHENRVLRALRALAVETGAYLLIGSLGIRLPGDDADKRMLNRSYLIAPHADAEREAGCEKGGSRSDHDLPLGKVVEHYDKIHMFDVPSLNGDETYRESRKVKRQYLPDFPRLVRHELGLRSRSDVSLLRC